MAVTNTEDKNYVIPSGYRKMENLHIVFWLFKDLSWCLGIKLLAGVMIFPTLIISLVITYRTRNLVSELCHNLAISVWIIANSYWMITEFLKIDEQIVFGNLSYKYLAVIPFTIGIIILMCYYLWWKPRNKHGEEAL